MRLGIDISQHQQTWEELLSRTQFAEEAGFDGAWVFDHFTPLYGDPSGPCMEAWTLLAALAASTERVRLGALVTGVTYRHPSLLATEAATVDNVSGGRLEFGIGAAWHQPEHQALGLDFPPAGERVRRLEEALQVIRAIWTQDGASFDGRYYRLDGVSYHPKPAQKPHPPVWIGAGGPKLSLPVVGRHADVWHTFGGPPDIERGWRIVAEHAEKAGRDPSKIVRSTSLSLSAAWDEVRRNADALRAAGVGYLTVSWPSEGKAHLEEFVDRVMPQIAGP